MKHKQVLSDVTAIAYGSYDPPDRSGRPQRRETVLAVRGHRCEDGLLHYIPSERGPSPTGIIREVVCVSGRLGARLSGLITNLS